MIPPPPIVVIRSARANVSPAEITTGSGSAANHWGTTMHNPNPKISDGILLTLGAIISLIIFPTLLITLLTTIRIIG